MKKLIILLLCVVLCLGVSGCGVNSAVGSSLINSGNNGGPGNVSDSTAGIDQTALVMTEGKVLTVFKNKFCAFHIASAGKVGRDYEIEVVCENRTEEEVSFTVNCLSINDWMAEIYMYEQVKPLSRYHTKIIIYEYELEALGLESVDKLSFLLEAYSSENWDTPAYVKNYFNIYTSGKDVQDIFIPEYKETGKELTVVDNDSIRMLITDINETSTLGTEITCYIDNRSNDALEIILDHMTLNGWTVSPHFLFETAPGTQAITSIQIERAVIEACGIESIDQIAFVVDADSIDGTNVSGSFKETVTLYPTGLSADDIEEPAHRPAEGEQVIVDDENLYVVFGPVSLNDRGDYVAGLYIHNRSDSEYEVIVNEVSLDGTDSLIHYRYEQLLPGAHHCSPIVIYDFDYEEIPETLQCNLHIQDASDQYADVFNDTITIEF